MTNQFYWLDIHRILPNELALSRQKMSAVLLASISFSLDFRLQPPGLNQNVVVVEVKSR
ncbi:MAG: hypothetical protein WBE14_19420 [Xanthobacteraceae bacterium]